jgi:DNA topoisomerase II
MASSTVVKLDHRTHILTIPDTYVGNVDKTTEEAWVFNESAHKIQKKLVNYVPGEYKIFDEIIVNAFDQYVRTMSIEECVYPVKNIWISLDKETGEITVKNDGIGISCDKHEKEGVFIPELIFGHLLTSSNYTKDKVKHVGGKNGYGAKLTNIFSKSFYLETVDHVSQKKYKQNWSENMTIKSKPSITKCTQKPYTLIKYVPDYGRFKLSGLENDMYDIMCRRAYDLAACTDNKVNVWLNNVKLECKNFEQYVYMFLGSDGKKTSVFERVNDRWEVIVAVNPFQEYEQISFVNGIFTHKGGKHVDYVTNQITKKLGDFIQKKKKITVKSNYIKENIVVFVKALIDNPSFNSQTKDCLTTSREKFGSQCVISDKFIAAFAKTGIVEKVIELAELKDSKGLKKNDGKKSNRVRDLPKLEDANYAGHKTKARECTLILTEGDSAKATAMAGLAVVGRDYYGVFPLKGKPPNVKDNKNMKKINDNNELNSIKKAMGLQSGKKYKNTDELRYGKIMILSDQDDDGTHIKGLVFNMFHTLWPTLYKCDGFLNSMLTPVIKARKSGKLLQFYSVKDYDNWKLTSTGKWNVKYYKGLGTSTPQEAREYFKQLHIVKYDTSDVENDVSINMAFGREDNSTTLRKEWLLGYNSDNTLDYTSKNVTIKEFIDQELIIFSNSDNIRSIPSVIDGQKPSQRKVIFSCLKRNLKSEIRVAQLAGYVSENAAYHHGEASLQGTIVNMAQTFVGSNNIHMLEPIGQFGTRFSGGKDCAQARYIHTQLCENTDKIFDKRDNPLLKYRDDDGLLVEPIYYVPTIPMLLVNGSSGIGTGWMTDIPSFNPIDIIANIKRYINGESMLEMLPYYVGFKGSIVQAKDNSDVPIDKTYKSRGLYTISGDKLEIRELPVGLWTDTYKEHLEKLAADKNNIRYYNSYCTDVDVHFEIFLGEELLSTYDKSREKFEKILKINSTISCRNLVAFNHKNKLVKYDNVLEMLEEYIGVRMEKYVERKAYMLEQLQNDLDLNEIKIRFITDFIEDRISIIKKRKNEIIEQLEERDYFKVDDSYDYLLRMPIYALSLDKIDELTSKSDNLKQTHTTLFNKSEHNLWMTDLDELKLTKPKETKFTFKKKK